MCFFRIPTVQIATYYNKCLPTLRSEILCILTLNLCVFTMVTVLCQGWNSHTSGPWVFFLELAGLFPMKLLNCHLLWCGLWPNSAAIIWYSGFGGKGFNIGRWSIRMEGQERRASKWSCSITRFRCPRPQRIFDSMQCDPKTMSHQVIITLAWMK